MDSRIYRAFAVGVLLLAGAAAIAIGAYNAGVVQGLAESGRMLAAPAPGTPTIYVWPRPFGFGIFPLFPLFFLVLLFFVVRGLLWRGRWHRGWRHSYEGVPPMFEEWHRRVHSRTTDPGSRTADPGMR
jgi:hypothetical protein